ncbi:MAG TPA: hypothetical protein VGO70_01520 [Arsenicitalea sp.]|jgi:hypothetical protein|nr:hypothetical protein [Arsenicitalea sp.]
MEQNKERRLFRAKSVTGEIYTVVEWRSATPSSERDPQKSESAGPSRLALIGGELVIPRMDGRLEIARTGEIIREVK